MKNFLLTLIFLLCGLAIVSAQTNITVEVKEPGTLTLEDFPEWEGSLYCLYLKGTFSIEDVKIVEKSHASHSAYVINCKDAYFLKGGNQDFRINEVGVTLDGRFPRSWNITSSLIVMPKTLKEIDTYQYPFCRRFILPDGFETIHTRAFEFDIIEQINIPSTVNHIGAGALYSCNLKTLRLSDEITLIPDTCIGMVNEKLHLPASLTEIRWRGVGFRGESLTLPAGLKRIGPEGLHSMTGLKELHCLAKEPPKCDHFLSEEEKIYFMGYEKRDFPESLTDVHKSECVLYVPKGCVEAYKNAEEWCDFTTILEEEDEYQEDMTGYLEWEDYDKYYSDQNSVNAVRFNVSGENLIYDLQGVKRDENFKGIGIIITGDGKKILKSN